jgi:Iap family predicted aminopeptidase
MRDHRFSPLVIGVIRGAMWCLSVTATAQTLRYNTVSQEIVEQRLGAFVTRNNLREPAIRRIFENAGCSAEKLTEQPVKGQKAPNLICALPGNTDRDIVVGAHFDLVEAGQGVVDNWSGASLLPSLYQGLASEPRRHTFRFVAFTGEEPGLFGSKAYVQQVAKTHQWVSAMVNMDTLGLAETEVWVSHADPNLVRLIRAAAATVKLPVSGVNVDNVGTTDSEPFREKKIPAITIHSVTAATLPILHTYRDRIEAIHKDEYYRTYQLVLAYLALLDQSLD